MVGGCRRRAPEGGCRRGICVGSAERAARLVGRAFQWAGGLRSLPDPSACTDGHGSRARPVPSWQNLPPREACRSVEYIKRPRAIVVVVMMDGPAHRGGGGGAGGWWLVGSSSNNSEINEKWDGGWVQERTFKKRILYTFGVIAVCTAAYACTPHFFCY